MTETAAIKWGRVLCRASLGIVLIFSKAGAAPGNEENAALPDQGTPQKEITFKAVTKEFLSRLNNGALAVADPATNTVFYDEETLSRFPAPFQEHVKEHEKAHIILDHAGAGGFGKKRWQIETEADCEALAKLKDEKNYGDGEIEQIKAGIRSSMESLAAEPHKEKARENAETRIGLMNACTPK